MKAIALVAASDFNAQDFMHRWKAGEFDFVMAVDGGYAHLAAAGVTPDLALGDFDSLGFVPQDVPVEQHPSHKNKSDLELAFDWLYGRGYSRVAVYGALGGRLDHTLACLQMCARFAEMGLEVTLVGAGSAVHVLVGPATFDIPSLGLGAVSVFSAVDECHGVTERGMEYPLERACLSNRTSLGLSNELLDQPASVEVQQGTLYVIYPV